MHPKNPYWLLNHWYQLPQGLRVGAAVEAELQKISAYLSGRNILQLGGSGKFNLIKHLNFRNKYIITPDVQQPNVDCYSEIANLPLLDASLDCVLAPFILEMCDSGYGFLREIDRVLQPNGLVVLFGINPLSFWGLKARIRWLPGLSAHLRSVLSVKNLLLPLGFQQCYLSSFFYIPPVNSANLLKNLEFLNEMGKMIWPCPAGFYCFIAQKTVSGANLIGIEQEDIDFAFKPN